MRLQSASDWQTHVGFFQALLLLCASAVLEKDMREASVLPYSC